ncbi:hypothetical protein XFEB_01521 [Xylella fastidiosa EB92.1]|nr:hypothetical protein XFEB_01521 [Xylella fastidiosa EB92.1]
MTLRDVILLRCVLTMSNATIPITRAAQPLHPRCEHTSPTALLKRTSDRIQRMPPNHTTLPLHHRQLPSPNTTPHLTDRLHY